MARTARLLAGVGLSCWLVALLSCAEGSAKDDTRVPPPTDSRFEQPVTDILTTVDADGGAAPAGSAIYVSATGNDFLQCGLTPQTPCATNTRGIARASSFSPVRPVLVMPSSRCSSLATLSPVQTAL